MMGRRPLYGTRMTRFVWVAMGETAHRAVTDAASRDGMTVAAWVRAAVEEALDDTDWADTDIDARIAAARQTRRAR